MPNVILDQVRKLRGISRHWHLVILAHTYLQLLLPEVSFVALGRAAAPNGQPPSPTLGDALQVHRYRQDRANFDWIRRHHQLYELIAFTKPLIDVNQAKVA